MLGRLGELVQEVRGGRTTGACTYDGYPFRLGLDITEGTLNVICKGKGQGRNKQG